MDPRHKHVTVADIALSHALVALADAEPPEGPETAYIWAYLGAVAARYGCASDLGVLGTDTPEQNAADLPGALRLVASRVAPPAPTLGDMLRAGKLELSVPAVRDRDAYLEAAVSGEPPRLSARERNANLVAGRRSDGRSR